GPNGQPGTYVTVPAEPGSTCVPTNGAFFVHGTTNTVTCTNTSGTPCIFTVIVLDDCADSCSATAISLVNCPNPDGGTYQCWSDVPPANPSLVTATNNCGQTDSVTFSETQSNQGSSCHNTITRTWTAIHLSAHLTNSCS